MENNLLENKMYKNKLFFSIHIVKIHFQKLSCKPVAIFRKYGLDFWKEKVAGTSLASLSSLASVFPKFQMLTLAYQILYFKWHNEFSYSMYYKLRKLNITTTKVITLKLWNC